LEAETPDEALPGWLGIQNLGEAVQEVVFPIRIDLGEFVKGPATQVEDAADDANIGGQRDYG
jgi:hypothetical protein